MKKLLFITLLALVSASCTKDDFADIQADEVDTTNVYIEVWQESFIVESDTIHVYL